MGLIKRIKEHSFELQHVITLFVILLVFQIVLIFLNKYSTSNLISNTMKLYRKDSAERIANLSATSLELLLEQSLINNDRSPIFRQDVIQAFNIIFSQQMLQENVEEICILVRSNDKNVAISDGEQLYSFFFEKKVIEENLHSYTFALKNYDVLRDRIRIEERIFSIYENDEFHIFVPFVYKGEIQGVVYSKITPDVSKIRKEISTAYNEISVVFTALILFGLLAMFYVTSYTVEERNLAQEQLFEEKEHQIKMEIAHEQESMFTKKIYHAHHKAEKIMGFIKEEIRMLKKDSIDSFKFTTSKYANFVSRVIYDMKSLNPPVHATRNPMFNSNINMIIKFLVENVFNRVYSGNTGNFKMDFDEKLPKVHINEYIIWQIIEPIIQNSIEHNREKDIQINLKTHYYEEKNYSEIILQDNGKGIDQYLLDDVNGIQKIFLEHESTKNNVHNAGYGCYIAYEICTKKCGWKIKAENNGNVGCQFVITINM